MESAKYISFPKHRQHVKNIEAKLLSIVKQDDSEMIELLQASPGDHQFNELIISHLQAIIDHRFGRTFKLIIKCFDGQQCPVYVAQNGTLFDLRQSIERDMSIRVQCKAKRTKRKRLYNRIRWKRVWRKYQLGLIDRASDLIDLVDNNKNKTLNIKQLSICNNSILKFAPRR